MAERDFIDFIAGHIPAHIAPGLQLGIGDDCAVVQKDATTSLLYTMDSLVEGVHFNLAFHPLRLLGRKSAAVNISDIAGMGGEPKFALLSMAMPQSFTVGDQQEFMAGFFAMCEVFGVTLIGGDTVSSESLNISVTLIGEVATDSICSRSGATPGDEVWVSGTLGDGSVGLGLLQAGQAGGFPDLVQAHLDPMPRVELGRYLGTSGVVTSMMDVSDGVATDLAHICKQSGCGALVHGQWLPISAMMMEGAKSLGLEPIHQALSGGEDYELLFTVKEGQGASLAQQVQAELGVAMSPIGVMEAGSGVQLTDGDGRSDVSYQGYEHQ